LAKQVKDLSTNIRHFNPDRNSNNERVDYQVNVENFGNNFEEPHPLKEYFRVVLVHRRLIMSVALVILALTTIHAFTATPMYTAETDISIGTYAPTIQGTRYEDSIAKHTEKQDYLETQIKLISRLTLADKILSDPEFGEEIKSYLNQRHGIGAFISSIFSIFSSENKLVEDENISSGDKVYENPIGQLRSYISLIKILPVKRTSLVKVSVTTSNPQLSAGIANTHAQSFIDISKDILKSYFCSS
jgi:uncharacterized protein involved in exopolysaccharide biosynthesis